MSKFKTNLCINKVSILETSDNRETSVACFKEPVTQTQEKWWSGPRLMLRLS